MIDLSSEFLDCQLPNGLALSRLRREGVTLGPYALYQLIRAARVAVEGNLFVFDDAGAPAFITPVRIDPENVSGEFETPDPTSMVLAGAIIDLCAWHPDAPSRFALRTGSARVLGCCGPQYINPPPVQIHRTVLAWIRSGGNGLVTLTTDRRECGQILRLLAGIVAEDSQHAGELRGLASMPWPVPKITALHSKAVAA